MLFGGPLLWSACVERLASKQQLVALEALSFSFSAARARQVMCVRQRLLKGAVRLYKWAYVFQSRSGDVVRGGRPSEELVVFGFSQFH